MRSSMAMLVHSSWIRITKMEQTNTNRPGRPSVEGKKRQYILPDDVHEWIARHGGSKYITDTMRIIKAVTD